MGYKEKVEKSGTNVYVLPQLGGMKVEVTAFLSEELFNQTDEALWAQAAQSASYPGAIGMYLMPDTHVGYSIPVGGVLVTEDVIVQAGSGYDISCGVLFAQLKDLTVEDVVDWDVRARWVKAVEDRIATGVGSHRPKAAAVVRASIDDVLQHGAAALGVDSSLCERLFIPLPSDVDLRKIKSAYSKAAQQLGTVGGGNHFIELQVDRDDGSVWAMVHCGSRGYGWQTANHFFYEGADLRGIAKNRREESWLRADEPLGKQYWAHHNSAANYAVANRWDIFRGVQEATQAVFNCGLVPYYEISHNLVQEETLVLPDGTTKRGFVHRKGATRAFPAGHPDLVGTKWSGTGHPVLVPGSMMAGAAMLWPMQGAYKSGCSVNHGSGRLLGRGQAKRELGELQDDIDTEMRTVSRKFGVGQVEVVGIVGNTDHTPLDECGQVYKDLDAVIAVLEEEGIAKLHRRLFPVANIKGTD